MQPLKITIYGDFWDCQIYMGRLYLWTINGELRIYNWYELVMSFIKTEEEAVALRCAFTNGDYLYGYHLQIIFKDNEFKNLLLKKFKALSERVLEFADHEIKEFQISVQDNPFKDLQTDSEILNKKLYGVTDSGFLSVTAHRPKSDKYLAGTKSTKIWDCPLLSIKADKYAKIALSGGSEGLFQYDAQEKKEFGFLDDFLRVEERIGQINKKHSLFANWANLSIYNSSNIDEDYMAVFKWVKEEVNQELPQKEEKYNRTFTSIVSETSIFNSNTKKYLSWGSKDKIFRAKETGVDIVSFNNNAREDENLFSEVKHIPLMEWKGNVICGGTSYFGTIIECDNALVVALSNGKSLTINGSITRWRVYPRSINYENHLHVVLDDRIEIYSFNHDYFIDQYSKDFGMTYVNSSKKKF